LKYSTKELPFNQSTDIRNRKANTMKVAVFSTKGYDREFFDKFKGEYKHTLTYFDTSLNPSTTILTEGFDAVCIFVNDKVNKETIEQLSNNGIKVIALRCAGFNNVDIVESIQKNIKVVRVPSYSPQAIAEHTVALILTLTRKTHKVYNRIKEGNFSLEKLMGFNLYRKTIGVIGTGKIGTAFCKIMLGFGCNVIAYDIEESKELKDIGIQYMPFDQVLSDSDIISLHCPLTPKTHQLLNKESLAKLKKGVMIINTSRGALINTSDVIDGLKTGKIGYLGIDVYEQEENLFFKDLSESIIQDDVFERLMSFHNVLITPHQGFFTDEALEQITKTTLQNLTDFQNGLPMKNEVIN
jgi:D-lactate dehydrogenase